MSTDNIEKLQENITCGHCSMKLADADEAACTHECFLDCERLNLSEDGILSRIEPQKEEGFSMNEVGVSGVGVEEAGHNDTGSKGRGIPWGKKAIHALIDAYESRSGEERSKLSKERLLFVTLTNDLATQGIRTTPLQLKWKWCYLKKQYKKSVEHIYRNGTGPIRFRYFDRMHKIFGKSSNTTYSACSTCKHINKSDESKTLNGYSIPFTNSASQSIGTRVNDKKNELLTLKEAEMRSRQLDIMIENLELKQRHTEIMERFLEIKEREERSKATRQKIAMAMQEKKMNLLAKILHKRNHH